MEKETTTLNCIIVDDEALSRKAVERCVELTGFLNLVGTYSNAMDAKMALGKKQVDLIFLDIVMPEMSGIEFVETFRDIPQIIMVTSKKEYAFEAFNYDVTDYISKPIEYPRFLKAVEKAVKIHETHAAQNSEDEYIFIKSDLALNKVAMADINWIEALGDYVRVITSEQKYTVLSTMKAFESKLRPHDFLRIHKSYIANLSKISKIDGNSVFIDGKTIPVSRTYKELLLSKVTTL